MGAEPRAKLMAPANPAPVCPRGASSLVASSGREPDTASKSRRSPFSDEHEMSPLVEERLGKDQTACAASVMETVGAHCSPGLVRQHVGTRGECRRVGLVGGYR